MHKFEDDFYGQELRLIICGYMRPSFNFASMGMPQYETALLHCFPIPIPQPMQLN